jgi:hypothetical protein
LASNLIHRRHCARHHFILALPLTQLQLRKDQKQDAAVVSNVRKKEMIFSLSNRQAKKGGMRMMQTHKFSLFGNIKGKIKATKRGNP